MDTHYRVVGSVPISNEDGVFISWIGERNWYQRPALDPNGSEATSCLVEGGRWEVEEGTYLIFRLHFVGEVLARRDRTRCPVCTIFIRILPLLQTSPARRPTLAYSSNYM